jgi:DNA-directed RNA polymerase subunit RPC12/RpoP
VRSRIKRLERAATGGDGGGCDRCRGLLVIVSDAITGEFHCASWNGEALSEEEAHERDTETKCPKCGARIESDQVIRVGGLGDTP